MRRRLGLLAVMVLVSAWPAFGADGAWKFVVDERDHPILTYSENGKEIFSVGCGRAFGVHANYPGAHGRKGRAVITIANAKTRMRLKGEIDAPEAGETGPAQFTQWDLGYRRQDPNLYEKPWHALKDRFFNLIDSGGPLTISAEGGKYVLPPVDAPNWQARFKEIC
jgi:hypothetical protein